MNQLVSLNKARQIDFTYIKQQQNIIQEKLTAAIEGVLSHGKYIQGPEVNQFEKQLGIFLSAEHVVSCANGTDALILALLALEIEHDDIVLLPSFTFAATAEAVAMLGATPYFVDSELDTYNISIDALKSAIQDLTNNGKKAKGIISVDLFGRPANYSEITTLAKENNLWVIADSAQSIGATFHGQPISNYADIVTTSFFPAKPLGCYGDGGAVITNNEKHASILKSLRVHGKGQDKYDNVRIGLNSRLDTLQAAILIEKLKIYEEELRLRNGVASSYQEQLHQVRTPRIDEDYFSSWAQYTVRFENSAQRDQVQAHLAAAKIPAVIYYAKPLHEQTAYQDYPRGQLTGCESLKDTVLSLPMSPYLHIEDIVYIAEKIDSGIKG